MEDLVMTAEFWKNKTVLLTGHTGFKGSWLSIWLKRLGVNLIGYSKNIPTEPSLFRIAKIENGMKSIMGNICDFNKLKKIIENYRPNIIIHMAAQSLVHKSYENPIDTYSTNVMGTINLLEAVRITKNSGVIINVTSDKCYDPKNNVLAHKEDDPLGGYDPYSNSKGCSELVTSSYGNSFFNKNNFDEHKVVLSSVRAGNVIGGGDWADKRLIPDIVRGVFTGKLIKIRYPNAIRPWQHVLDPLNGYLILAQKLSESGAKYVGAWNFGPTYNEEKPVSWIINKFNQSLDEQIRWEIDQEIHNHEENILRLDCSKAQNELGWNSKISLDLAIKLTAYWYKQYKEKNNMQKITEEQISSFES